MFISRTWKIAAERSTLLEKLGDFSQLWNGVLKACNEQSGNATLQRLNLSLRTVLMKTERSTLNKLGGISAISAPRMSMGNNFQFDYLLSRTRLMRVDVAMNSGINSAQVVAANIHAIWP